MGQTAKGSVEDSLRLDFKEQSGRHYTIEWRFIIGVDGLLSLVEYKEWRQHSIRKPEVWITPNGSHKKARWRNFDFHEIPLSGKIIACIKTKAKVDLEVWTRHPYCMWPGLTINPERLQLAYEAGESQERNGIARVVAKVIQQSREGS